MKAACFQRKVGMKKKLELPFVFVMAASVGGCTARLACVLFHVSSNPRQTDID